MRISASFVLIAAFLSLSACRTGSTGDGIEVHDATIEAAAQGDSRVVYLYGDAQSWICNRSTYRGFF